MTSPERHRRVKELFLAACDLDGAERGTFLDRECADDPALRSEVEELLAVDTAGVSLLERPVLVDAGPERIAPAELERLAQRAAARGYVVEDELGRGGMGRVLRARDVDLHRELAMKVCTGGPSGSNPELRATAVSLDAARFLEEARTTARLDHPGIVPVHDLGLDGEGHLFFTMKLVQGRDLDQVLRSLREGNGDWSLTRLVGVLQKVAEAVAFAHSKGVVHRDLKPANVMVGEYGEVYVMDWGISRVVGERSSDASAQHPASDEAAAAGLTRSGSILGTPYSMAPEQARGELVGPPADVYALGAMLYQALAGRRPYESAEGERAQTVLLRIHQGPPRPLRELAPSAPAELVSIAERAMQREPERRYADMRALAEDLRAYLEQRVVRAHRTGALAELRKWVARNRLAASGLLVGLTAIVGGLAWSRQTQINSSREIDLASDFFRARVACDVVDELWPATPAGVPRLVDWIGRVEGLLARRGVHAERLRRLETGPATDPTELDRQRALLASLTELGGPAEGGTGLLQQVQARLNFARTIEERSLTNPTVAALWRAARERARAADGPYGGLELAPQLGLVPLGADPASGLLEFVHLESGEPPVRDGEGRLLIGPETGIVLVLVPGGTFHMGASREPGDPNHDPNADQNERPVVEVTLRPFLLSKYELTQGQWQRLTGDNPSRTRAEQRPGVGWTNPVEQISGIDAARVLERRGLILPSEARWEYACRAGSATPFHAPFDELFRYANVADRSYFEGFAPTYAVEPFDDGFAGHAPVGSLAPNAFGLHDMHGNVFEWTSDGYGSHAHPRSAEDGRSLGPQEPNSGGYWSAEYRVIRGGCFEVPSHYARSSHRVNFGVTTISHALGVRPARELESERGP